MSDNNRYADGHWSTIVDSDAALKRYLAQYNSIYNSRNIERLISIAPNEPVTILDYGGGCGMLSVNLAKMKHEVTLVDASEFAVKTAKYFAKQEGVILEAKTANSISDAELNKKFDLIYAKDLIEHVQDDINLVHEFANALKPGGLLVLTTQNSLSLNYLIEAGLRKLFKPKEKWMGWDRTHLRFYTPRKLTILIESCSLSLEYFESAYIFPYKLLSRIIPSIDPHKHSIFFKFDKLLSKYKMFSKAGWNIMVVARKKQ
jgi:2-polyprenyl-6-hydroxyphenyl methylase/3-demethylubiquinone-9 3-methyltransferase